MLVSFMLPTRHMEDEVLISLKSLIENSSQKHNWEILIALDDDDKKTLSKIPLIDELFEPYDFCSYKIEIMERQGYSKLQNYYNRLAELSSGEFLFLWNDDAVMITPFWDLIIKEDFDLYPEKICLFPLEYNYKSEIFEYLHYLLHNGFPIVRREWLDILGHFATYFKNDTYVMNVALGYSDYSRIVISHDNGHETNANDWTQSNQEIDENNWVHDIVNNNLKIQEHYWKITNSEESFVYNNLFGLWDDVDLLLEGTVSGQVIWKHNVETPSLKNHTEVKYMK